MHRDMKVGFALGVLLVGVVGALFFRREPARMNGLPPALKTAAELNDQLAARPHGPYILGPEEFADGVEPTDAPRPLPSTSADASPKAYQVPNFLSPEDARIQREILSGRAAATPDPIRTGDSPATAPGSAGASDGNWETVGPDAHAGRNGQSAGTAGNMRPYVTQAGDTLSGLAGRFLGSTARYQDLYEMNRSVLKSPHSLPEGVTIMVPAGVSPRSGEVSTSPPAGKPSPVSVGQGWETVSDPKSRLSTSPNGPGAADSESSAPAAGPVRRDKVRGAAPAGERPVPPENSPRPRPTDDDDGPIVERDETGSPVFVREKSNSSTKSLFRASNRGRAGGRITTPASSPTNVAP